MVADVEVLNHRNYSIDLPLLGLDSNENNIFSLRLVFLMVESVFPLYYWMSKSEIDKYHQRIVRIFSQEDFL